MKIVVLDGHTVNPGDLNWGAIEALGEVTIYARSHPEEIIDRSSDAEVLVINKVKIDREIINALPQVKGIFLSATGYDNVDIKAAETQGIAVYNAVGYGTESVAQHTLALLLTITNRVTAHHQSVRSGGWADRPDFSYTLQTVTELREKKIGIIGLGRIGRRVAELAQAFGMHALALQGFGAEVPGVRKSTLAELLTQVDYLSLHAPLTEITKGLINTENLSRMKRTAWIINTGRGGLIIERDLLSALATGKIAGAALDVLSVEPPLDRNPLITSDKTIITPHMAWSSKEARTSLIRIVAENIQRFKVNDLQNRVV